VRACVALAHEAARLAAATRGTATEPFGRDRRPPLGTNDWTGARHSDDGHARDERTREESDDDDETKLCRGFRLSPRYDDDDDDDDARDGLANCCTQRTRVSDVF